MKRKEQSPASWCSYIINIKIKNQIHTSSNEFSLEEPEAWIRVAVQNKFMVYKQSFQRKVLYEHKVMRPPCAPARNATCRWNYLETPGKSFSRHMYLLKFNSTLTKSVHCQWILRKIVIFVNFFHAIIGFFDGYASWRQARTNFLVIKITTIHETNYRPHLKDATRTR